MKRLFLLSLALCLLLGASALAESSCVPSDRMTALLSVSPVITEDARAYLEENVPTQEALEAALATAIPISISHTGDSAIVLAGHLLLALREDGARIICPSTTRSVADEYGKLAARTKNPLNMLSADEVKWSPDGRYAMITDWYRSVNAKQMLVDPAVIDTTTGEIVLLATYPRSNVWEGRTGVISASFSQDGKYLYYMLYSNQLEHIAGLMRVDLATGETALCAEIISGTPDHADLLELANGSMMCLTSDYRARKSGISLMQRLGDSFRQVPLEFQYYMPTW